MIEAALGHLVGDFLFQNDYLAREKKKSSLVCLAHATIWTLCVCVFAGWFDVLTALWLLTTHHLIDRYNAVVWVMRRMGQSDFIKNCGPWSVIVVDNTWHLLTIWAAWRAWHGS